MRLKVLGVPAENKQFENTLREAGHIIADPADLEVVVTNRTVNPAAVVSALINGFSAVRRYKKFVIRLPKPQRAKTSSFPAEPKIDNTLPSIVIRGLRRSVYISFDQNYARYAAALTRSVLELNPGWTIRAFTTNVDSTTLSCYPWTDTRVTLSREDRTFKSDEERRTYMAVSRFTRYTSELHRDDVAVMLDADMICLGRFDSTVEDMLKHGEDFAIIQRPQLEERRKIRACTIISLQTPAVRQLWQTYGRLLPEKPEWYADQIALYRAICKTKDLKVRSLPESVWCSFEGGPDVKMLATCTQDKSAFSEEWHRQYLRRYGECVDNADGPRGRASDVALVWVMFGHDEARHKACLTGMSKTLLTDRPGRIILYEAVEGSARYEKFARSNKIEYRKFDLGPRHRGVWQKENLWQIALNELSTSGSSRWAVFMDSDCTPSVHDWASRVAEMHEAGAKAFQPWRETIDTEVKDIGGVSASWTLSRRNGSVDQPGFCWSVDVRFMVDQGGFSCIEPLGGGDTILAQWYLGNRSGLSNWADHMAWAKVGARRRVTPAALDIVLSHASHGPRDNRLYTIRYPVAALASNGKIMSLYEKDEQGLLRIVEGPTGDAWLLMLARRSEWSATDMAVNRKLWESCLICCGVESPVDPGSWQNIGGWFSNADAEIYRRWASECPDNCTIVELGTHFGRSAACLMEALDNKGKKNVKLVCVDFFPSGIVSPARNLNKWKGRVHFVQTDTVKAAKLFSDNSVWAVYIDSSHRKEHTLREIEAWAPKITADGFLGGHDYHNSTWPEVQEAVSSKFSEDRIQVMGSSWQVCVETACSRKAGRYRKGDEGKAYREIS
jgi:hypothetical protein